MSASKKPDWSDTGRRGKSDKPVPPPAPPAQEPEEAVAPVIAEASAPSNEESAPAPPPPHVSPPTLAAPPPPPPKRGDVVHYSLANGDAAVGTAGDCRPATVVDVVGNGRLKISVVEPQAGGRQATFRVTVPAGEARQPGTWHWPERA